MSLTPGKAARGVFILVVAALLVLTVLDQGPALGRALGNTSVTSVLLAVVAALSGLLASGLCWRALLRALGSPLERQPALRIFFVGQLGKYVPGSVFAIAAQTELGRAHRLPRTRVVTAGLLLLAVLTATGLLVAVAVLPFASPDVLNSYAWVLLFLPVGLAVLAPPVLEWFLTTALRFARRPALDAALDRRALAASVGWALVMWGCYGLHLLPLVLAQPHHGSWWRLLVTVTGGYALAWTAGFLFLIAPAGAGVREAVLVLALASALARPEATAVAILSRGVMTLGDLFWAAVLAPRPGKSLKSGDLQASRGELDP